MGLTTFGEFRSDKTEYTGLNIKIYVVSCSQSFFSPLKVTSSKSSASPAADVMSLSLAASIGLLGMNAGSSLYIVALL